MQKIILILALAMFYNNSAGAKDRDCVKYTAEEAKEAVGDSESTSFTAAFSHASERNGTNSGCAASDSPYVRDDLPAPVAKYDGALLVFDLAALNSGNYGVTPSPDAVTWYQVNPNGGEDTSVGTGLYLTTPNASSLPAGSYYAVITDGDNQYRTQITEVTPSND